MNDDLTVFGLWDCFYKKGEGGFVPERDQFYFEMRQGDHVFMVGFKDLLICLRLLEKMDEIPKIGEKWWQQMATLYGNDIYMLKYDEAKYMKSV